MPVTRYFRFPQSPPHRLLQRQWSRSNSAPCLPQPIRAADAAHARLGLPGSRSCLGGCEGERWAGDVIQASEAGLRTVGGRLPTVLSVGKEARLGVQGSLVFRTGAQGRETIPGPHLGKLRTTEVWRCGEESPGVVGVEDLRLGWKVVDFLERSDWVAERSQSFSWYSTEGGILGSLAMAFLPGAVGGDIQEG